MEADQHLDPQTREAAEAKTVREAMAVSFHDPVFFADSFLQLEVVTDDQRDALRAVAGHKRVHIRAAHSVGKTFIFGVIAVWFGCTRCLAGDSLRIITTATVMRQVEGQLWGEIAGIHRHCMSKGIPLPGVLYKTPHWRIGDRQTARGFATDKVDKFTGEHAVHVLILLDEGHGISHEIVEGCETSMQGEDSKLVMACNPIRPSGPSYAAFQSDDWFNVKMDAFKHVNVTSGTEIVKGAVTQRWIDEMRKAWGEDSPAFMGRVLGEFPTDDTFGLIGHSHIQAACSRFRALNPVRGGARKCRCRMLRKMMGVDVARLGEDETTFIIRDDVRVHLIEAHAKTLTMEVVDRTRHLAAEWGIAPEDVFIDVIGSGVVDVLHDQGFNCVGVNFGAGSDELNYKGDKVYANVRAECYHRMAKALDPEQGAILGLPDDEQLLEELATIPYGYKPTGEMLIEPKDKIKALLKRSPDRCDGLAMTYADTAPEWAYFFPDDEQEV